jgi:hypothetical protein
LESYLESEKEWDDCLAFKPHHLKEGQLQSYFFQNIMSTEEYRQKLILRYSLMTDDYINSEIIDPVNKVSYAQDIRGGLPQEHYNKYFESHLLPFLLAKYEEFISMPEDSKVIISSFRDFLCGTSRFTCNREQYIHCGLDANTLQEHFKIMEILPTLSQQNIHFISRTQPTTVNITVGDFYRGQDRILTTIPKQVDLVENIIETHKDKAGIVYEIVKQQAITDHVRQESKRMIREELDKS